MPDAGESDDGEEKAQSHGARATGPRTRSRPVRSGVAVMSRGPSTGHLDQSAGTRVTHAVRPSGRPGRGSAAAGPRRPPTQLYIADFTPPKGE